MGHSEGRSWRSPEKSLHTIQTRTLHRGGAKTNNIARDKGGERSCLKIGDPLDKIKPKPDTKMMYREILFPDGKQYPLMIWSDVLLRTVRWLAETNRLTKNLPFKTRGYRYIVNTKPYHRPANHLGLLKKSRVSSSSIIGVSEI